MADVERRPDLLGYHRMDGLANEPLSQSGRDIHFAMHSNGYFMQNNGSWRYNPETVSPFAEEFAGQRVSFFGPQKRDKFFSVNDIGESRLLYSFSQQPVVDAIRKYRNVDEEQAARIAYLLGGLVRQKASDSSDTFGKANEIALDVRFTARMASLGEQRSGDAITSAMTMYLISGGSPLEDYSFKGDVYQMSEAIRHDPIEPKSTKDLGLSQVARINGFIESMQGQEYVNFPDTGKNERALEGFPTVGAEFHFSPDAPDQFPNFWQRLAILNMSQYQRGSFIQLSRNDRGVIEVRMNPSTYPITVANWRHMKLLLPELNNAFFTMTFNRGIGQDFNWENYGDNQLLNKLRSIGMLAYASLLDKVPAPVKSEEIDFGSVYLGQTVKVDNDGYRFTGFWSGGEGDHGQMGIYAGYDGSFPYLAYYPSMVLANPDILDCVPDELLEVRTLQDAMSVSPKNLNNVFSAMNDFIEEDEMLGDAAVAGRKISEQLTPFH